MRAKTIVEGFRNSQRFRYIITVPGTKTSVGMYISIRQMSEDFATTAARAAVWTTMNHLAYLRRQAQRSGESVPTGIVRREQDLDVQVDLV
jgi:hypothetical protein